MRTRTVPPKPMDTDDVERMLRQLQAITVAAVGFVGSWLGAQVSYYITGTGNVVDPALFVVCAALGALIVGYITAGFVRWVGRQSV